ncbi:MAG: hypothetical protein JO320_24190 [Alphaproteobacteria bacterium]|nr:hypothetical protein [Alphaproteobacteria bacterium]
MKTRGGDLHNVTRLWIHLPPGLASKNLALLTVDELRHWRDGLGRRAASINRICTILKAALNLTASKDTRLSSRTWEIGLATIPDADESRNVILREIDILALIEGPGRMERSLVFSSKLRLSPAPALARSAGSKFKTCSLGRRRE